MKNVFICNGKSTINSVWGEENTKKLAQILPISDRVYTYDEVMANKALFADTENIFSTWGMPSFTKEEIAQVFPQLKNVYYAAGSVQYFARPFLESGVRVFSAWAANGVPVAEYTVAQIILANKGFFSHAYLMNRGQVSRAYERKGSYPGNFSESVGLIGCGMIGTLVAQMLKSYRLSVMVYDPFLSEERAKELGVTKCEDLKLLFASCRVVSNHLANNEATRGMLNYDCFSKMLPYATFINTGRGAQVVEADLVRALVEREDLTAVLDVTYPEPAEAGHLFYSLPNCFLTPHIAGSLGNEVRRMSEYMIEECRRAENGEECRYAVSLAMLETMA